jgi:hypothetical protein
MTCSILHDTSFVLVPRDGRLVFGNDSLVSRERKGFIIIIMDVRDHGGNLAGPREKATTKVAPIKVEYHFMTKQTS